MREKNPESPLLLQSFFTSPFNPLPQTMVSAEKIVLSIDAPVHSQIHKSYLINHMSIVSRI
jgi:hypothetical protein